MVHTIEEKINGFWNRVANTTSRGAVTELLREMAMGEPTSDKPTLTKRRRQFMNEKFALLPLGKDKLCIGCPAYARERHHIIPLGRGGPNNEINLVPLCVECHNKVHPWRKRVYEEIKWAAHHQ